tara:strand:+ start:19349 stop:20884 length:1536 start_codon:yes stop_codon:yes gene_type:complete
MTGLLLSALDQTIVATALPKIVGELGGLDYYSWIVTAYLLSTTVSTPLYGKLSDLYGRRLMFQVAILVFVAGSLFAGLAQGMLQLIFCRAVQGIGAGGLMAMTFAVVGDVVSPRQRGRYIGLLAGTWAFASVIGPLIGGFIVDNMSWRWVFLINLPIGIVAFAVTSSVLRLPTVYRSHRIDIEGVLFLVGGVSAVLLALVWGGTEYPWSSSIIRILLISGMSLLVIFIWWEDRAAEPILPLRLFKNSIFSVSSALGFLTGCGMFGGVIFLPLFLQVVLGVSATSSGLLLLPLTAGVVIGSVGSGRVISHTGRYRIWPIGGLAFAAVGMFLLSLMTAETSFFASSLYMLIMGLGVGSTMQVTILVVQNAVDHSDLGVATSAAQFFRQMGGSFGVAVFGSIMNYRLAADLPSRVPPEALEKVGGRLSEFLSSPEVIRSLPQAVSSGVIESVELAINTVFIWAVPPMVLGFVLAWFLQEIPLRETIDTSSVVEGAGEVLDKFSNGSESSTSREA